MDFKYSSLGSPAWTPFEDSEYDKERGVQLCSKRPRNRRFEVLNEQLETHGEIVIHTCHQNEFYNGSTPWGELEIKRVGLTNYEVFRRSIAIGAIKERLSGMKAIVSFQPGQELLFKGRMLWYSHIRAQTESGAVSIKGESGRRTNPGPNQQASMSRKDYRSLTESQKKELIETDLYAQWRISLYGLLPARDDDILGVLAMGICRSVLYAEYVAKTIG